jgi:hypothetical protein
VLTLEMVGQAEPLVPLVHACRALGWTYQRAHGRILAGQLPAERIDGRWYVRLKDLERLLAAGEVARTRRGQGPKGTA